MAELNLTVDTIRDLASRLGCGIPFAHDLLVLANGDIDLVIEASSKSRGADSVKAYILNHRIGMIEDRLAK